MSWTSLAALLGMCSPFILFWFARQDVKKTNRTIEAKWRGEIPSSKFAGKLTDVAKDGQGAVGDSQQVTSIQHSVIMTEKEHAIWGIVSDELTTQTTVEMQSRVCDAFKRLGRPKLAAEIWATVQRQDYYLPENSGDAP